jgi:hypothetical protein
MFQMDGHERIWAEALLGRECLPPADPQIEQQQAQVRLAAYAELFQDVAHVGFHGFRGEHKDFRDFSVGVAAGCEPCDLLLAGGEGFQDGLHLRSLRFLLKAPRQQLCGERLRSSLRSARCTAKLGRQFGVDLEHQTSIGAKPPAQEPHRDLHKDGLAGRAGL